MHRRGLRLAAAFGGLLALAPAAGRASSELELPAPNRFGVVPAATYDERGRRVGDAHLVVERLDGGKVRLLGESGIDGAERTVVSAVLEPLDGSPELRPVEQSSRSFDAAGEPLGVLMVDHRAGVGRCLPAGGNGDEPRLLDLPDPDRVANVPVNLLFLPLARGSEEEVRFQILLCSGGPRLVDARAKVAGRSTTEDGIRDIVEVHYDVDLGPLLSTIARPFVPQVAVWLDPDSPEGWIAHRMPLFSKGPMVLVVRTGIPPAALAAEQP